MGALLAGLKAGIIADIVVAVLIVINLVICTHRGFIRCVITSFSTVIALVVAFLSAAPLAHFLESAFGWETAIAKWNIPIVSAGTLLTLFSGIVVFIVVRLVCILLDKLLQSIKEKLRAVNILDRILGTLFGLLAAFVELTLIFLLIDSLGWTEAFSLTESGGGYFAFRIFDFCKKYLFNLLTSIVAAAAANTPKI